LLLRRTGHVDAFEFLTEAHVGEQARDILVEVHEGPRTSIERPAGLLPQRGYRPQRRQEWFQPVKGRLPGVFHERESSTSPNVPPRCSKVRHFFALADAKK